MKTTELTPWIRGLQNLYDPARTPQGAVLEANNVLIEADGALIPRTGYAPTAANAHSLFKHRDVTYGVMNNAVVTFGEDAAQNIGGGIQIDRPVSWAVINDQPVFLNKDVLGIVSDTGAKLLGLPVPVFFAADLSYVGNKAYGAASFITQSGEEGPLSAVYELVDGQHPSVSIPAGYDIVGTRRYETPVLNFSGRGNASSFVTGKLVSVSDKGLGQAPTTVNKARMPGGDHATYWRGRLLVARGRFLYISEPMRYGLYDLQGGVVPFERKITFIESVENGFFVGVRNVGVYFLSGSTPADLTRRLATPDEAQYGSSLLIPAGRVALDTTQKPEWVAVWFSPRGFAIGLPSGDVVYPQAELLDNIPIGKGSLHFEDDRLIALSQPY